ncbi:MAG TPA: secretion system protein, partial [Gammaproteobacteria bacterium]|nr:secretion system protein [Gammaproteobacteria bacterium]
PGVALITLWIEQSGQTIKLQNFLGAMVAISIGSFVAVLIGTHNLLYAGIGAFVGFFLPVIHLAKKKHDRLANFDDHLTDAMDIMIRALKAGHPFNTSLQLVSEELKGPISEEMAITFAELNFGESTQTALTNLIRRVPSKLLKSVVTAILLQRETGGNLAEILEKINKVVRDSHRFQRNLKTLAAEGKMSAIVLASVPVVLGIGMYFIQPDVMAELFINPTGHTLLKISAVLYTIGFFWIRILIKIDV